MNKYQRKNCVIQPFLQIFFNWRIKTQILMVQLFVSSLVVIFIALSYYYSFYIVRQIFITNHENILLKKYLVRSTNNNLHHYKEMTRISLVQTDILLYQAFNFYEFSFRDNLYINYDPLQCLQKPPNDTIILKSTFCYGIFGNREHIGMNVNLNNLSKVLTLFIPLLQTDNIYYGSSSVEQYFSYWPGTYFNDSFVPHRRIWYIIARNTRDPHKIQYTPPYLSVIGRIYVSKMTKLSNDGVVSINTKLPNYQLNINSETPQILDQNGLFYYTQEYENLYQNILYFNESNKTGFTQEDLKQILNLRNNKSYNNSCDTILQNSICRRNIYGKEYNFFTSEINYPNLTIIVKIESNKFKIILNDLFQQLDQFKDQVLENLYITIACTLSLCLLFFLGSSQFLQKPLDELLGFSAEFMLGQKLRGFNLERASILLSSQTQSQTIFNLQQAFINLVSLEKATHHSNQEKITIQKIKYPKRSIRIRVASICQKTMINYQKFRTTYLDQMNKILKRVIK